MSETETTNLPAVVTDPGEAFDLLAGLAELETIDVDQLSQAQLRRILYAQDEAEAFAETPTYSSEDLIDQPIEVRTAALLPSTYNDGKGAYVAADITVLATGEVAILTTSATRPAARIMWLSMNGKLPRQVVVTVVKETTAKGRRILGLEIIG